MMICDKILFFFLLRYSIIKNEGTKEDQHIIFKGKRSIR